MREERLQENCEGRTLYLSSLEARGNSVFRGVTITPTVNESDNDYERGETVREWCGEDTVPFIFGGQRELCFSWCNNRQSHQQSMKVTMREERL